MIIDQSIRSFCQVKRTKKPVLGDILGHTQAY